MPTYEYACNTCNTLEEVIHSIKETPTFNCSKCGAVMERKISRNLNFIIKGESVSKDWKEERYRVKRSAEMGVKQVERWGGNNQSLKPNVAGVETESWSDAAAMAKEAGLSADTYTPLIEKEKRTSKVSGIDDQAWKTAKAVKENF